ncbi:MAG: selenocysteine-specific translation elongation factor [Candidatus Eremiobacteraeota bacterium]|nr:selenocysteine-specific translation elongation factor [Candidatus Eremiobacteraeota bacterium]MBV9646994.1 selenocysteine-specific translation elongation factor [Candidatus Eremiobacteraeota bacterium]
MHILGTAGHVDHGKSSLVRALTGTDPDRWIEEKLRGMTLDLGFAHLRFDDGVEAGVVDVPGHERFLHNMLAGAAGMELLLLVVAANDGPRPQTTEHLAILSYLNVRRAIVVLTKSDLVAPGERVLVEAVVRDSVRGTVAEGAPVLAVSTLTGEGMPTLREAIHEALRELPERAPSAPPYLPIDRVFALSGHGTIVTGTLMQGEIAVGDTLSLSPRERRVRVRSLQVFGERRERVSGGSRVAVNLPGIETSEVHRGAVLAGAQFIPQRSFAVAFRPYGPALRKLRRRTPVRAYIGSAEILGTLQLEWLPQEATADVAAHVHLRAATIALPGGAFVVRSLSPKDLLGGGTFTAIDAAEGTDDDDNDSIASALLAALRETSYHGGTASSIGARANVKLEVAVETLERLCERGRVYRLVKPDGYIEAGVLGELEVRIREALARNESATPWSFGSTLLALSRALGVPEAPLLRVLTRLVEDGLIGSRAGYYATPSFTPRLTAEQQAFFERELPVAADQPHLPASLSELRAHVTSTRISGLSQALDTLVASGALVKVGDAVYRGSQIAAVRRKLEDALGGNGELTMAGFRDLVGTSRKYAVPLLEWFDATGVTVRTGDVRRLRRHPGGARS